MKTDKKRTFKFVRFHSKEGAYVALLKEGRKFITLLMVREFPVRIYRVDKSELRFCTEIGPLDKGVIGFKSLATRVAFNVGSTAFLNAAEASLKDA